jgi:hypothetical protein
MTTAAKEREARDETQSTFVVIRRRRVVVSSVCLSFSSSLGWLSRAPRSLPTYSAFQPPLPDLFSLYIHGTPRPLFPDCLVCLPVWLLLELRVRRGDLGVDAPLVALHVRDERRPVQHGRVDRGGLLE